MDAPNDGKSNLKHAFYNSNEYNIINAHGTSFNEFYSEYNNETTIGNLNKI